MSTCLLVGCASWPTSHGLVRCRVGAAQEGGCSRCFRCCRRRRKHSRACCCRCCARGHIIIVAHGGRNCTQESRHLKWTRLPLDPVHLLGVCAAMLVHLVDRNLLELQRARLLQSKSTFSCKRARRASLTLAISAAMAGIRPGWQHRVLSLCAAGTCRKRCAGSGCSVDFHAPQKNTYEIWTVGL